MVYGFRSRAVAASGRGALLGALLTSAAIPAGILLSMPEAAAQTSRQISFDIPAGPLRNALVAFGRQSGTQVSYEAAIASGKTSPGLRGVASREQAIAQILRGSGLVHSFPDRASVLITRPRSAEGAVDGAIALDQILVEGPGALPAPFAGGQVASGGRLGVLGNRDIMNTPFNITSYTAKTIADQQARSIADVAKNDPSVRATWADGSYSNQFFIRGLPLANPDISINGLYGLVPYQMSGTGWVERVEILKGPSALLNGMAPQGSVGGNINLVTKRAPEEPLNRVTLGFISNGQFGGKVDFARRFGAQKEFGLRVNGTYSDGDSPVDGQRNKLGEGSVGLDYRGDRVRLSADVVYQSNYADNPVRPVYARAGFRVPRAPGASSDLGQSWYYSDGKDILGIARAEVDITDDIMAYAAVGARSNDFIGLYNFSYIKNARGDFDANNYYQPSENQTRTGEVGLRAKLNTGPLRHEITVSATGLYSELGVVAPVVSTYSSNLYRPGWAPYPNLANYSSKAPKTSASTLTSFAITDSIFALDDRVQLILGARHQIVRQKGWNATTRIQTADYDERATTPAIGLVLKPWENVSFYANYIEGLSQGPTAPAGSANVGEAFAPIKSKQYEAGVKAQYGTLGATLSAFQIEQPSGVLNTATNRYSVDGEQRNRGLELNIYGEAVQGVRLLGGVVLMDGKQTKTANAANNGKTAIGVPDVQLNLGAEWDTPFIPGLTLTGRLVYTSSQYVSADNSQSIPSWTRVDLGARYTFNRADGKPVTIRASVENVLDKDYWAAASSSFGLARGAPRTYLVSTTFDF